MSSYKEIVTKAVLGKGKKYIKNNYNIEAENTPTTVLGCWVINHKFKGYKTGDKVGVNGSFDVNIWYSYDDDSKTTVLNKKIEYNEIFDIKNKNDITDETDIIVRTLKQPTCSKVEIKNNKILFDIEKELGVEIVGETKIKILTEDDEEPWDNLDENIDTEIDNEIKEKYI